jgi:hypothetical protein
MNLLTDAEIKTIADKTQTAEPGTDGYILPFSFANEIIAATVARLSSMPVYPEEAIAAARVAALEEAAAVVEADAVKNPVTAYQLQYNISLEYITKDIRALIDTNLTTVENK